MQRFRRLAMMARSRTASLAIKKADARESNRSTAARECSLGCRSMEPERVVGDGSITNSLNLEGTFSRSRASGGLEDCWSTDRRCGCRQVACFTLAVLHPR